MLVCGVAAEDKPVAPVERFKACENKTGAGFFWTDTTNGQTWWLDPGQWQWVPLGVPEGATAAPPGTYLPYANKSGDGVFVLNTVTGEGWWTNGKEWRKLGKPEGVCRERTK